MRDAGRIFAGSCVVYLGVAAASACGSAPRSSSSSYGPSTSGGSAPNQGGAPTSIDGGASMGGLMDPVPSARADEPQDGSRLVVRWLTSADGARLPAGFYDMLRQEECSPTIAGDGKLRCMPNAAAARTEYFARGCVTQLYMTGCDQPTARYAADTNECFSRQWRLTIREHTGPVYQGTPDACEVVDPPSGARFYTLGPEVTSSDFAALDVRMGAP